MLKNTINNNNFNVDEFIYKGNRAKRILNLPEFVKNESNVIHLSYKDKLTKNESNKDVLYQSLLEKNTTTLVIAPTGSGKTFAMDEISHKLYKKSKEKELCILLCPNKIQNLQNEMSYRMACLIKGSKQLNEYNLNNNDITFSAVYDKIKTILDSFEALKQDHIKLHLIIDEAHLLIEQNNFRKDCVNNLFEAMRLVKQNNGNVLLLTATPNSLLTLSYDKIINFTSESQITTKAKRMVVFRNKSNQDMCQFTYNRIKDQTDPTLIRYNSIKTIEKLKNDLLFKNQKTVLTLDGKQKQFSKIGNKIVCRNPLFYDIINEENLPTSYKGEKVNTYLTTSVLEVGTNIHSIGNKQDPNLKPTFVIQDKNQMSLNSMVQFFNRVRYEVNEYHIYMPYVSEIKEIPFQSLENILIDDQKKVFKFMDSFNKTIEAIQLREDKPILVLNELNRILELKNINGEVNHLGCIYAVLDGTSISVQFDCNGFFQQCYNKYIQQYFFKQELYFHQLESLFGVEVIVKDIEDDTLSDDSDNEELLKNFQSILDNPDLQKEIINKEINSPEILAIQQSDLFQQVLTVFKHKNLISDDFESNLKESFVLFIQKATKKQIKIEKRNVLSTLFKNLSKQNYRFFIKFLHNQLNCDEIDSFMAYQFHLMKEDISFCNQISDAINLNFSHSEIVNLLQKNIKLKDLKAAVKQKQFKKGNDNYLQSQVLLSGKSGLEQKVILDFLYVKNDSGNLVQKTINKSLIQQIKLKLKESLGSIYQNSKIKELISLCFHLVTVNKQKRIISLK